MLEADNVLVVHLLQQTGLLFQQLDSLFVQRLPFDYFYCDLLARFFVNRLEDCAEGPLAEHFLELIVLRISSASLQL